MFDNDNKRRHLTLAAALLLGGLQGTAWADQYEDAAKKWIGSEFKPSTLSAEQQMAELKWFIKAAEPFRGMKINVVSETLMWWRSCRRRCSRTRTSTTAGSTIPT